MALPVTKRIVLAAEEDSPDWVGGGVAFCVESMDWAGAASGRVS